MPSRISIGSTLLAIALATVAPGAGASTESVAELIIGNWACEAGDCPDEEIAFSIVDGVRTYDSWLHARPSASGGDWSLDGDRLTIRCCAGIEYDYVLVRVTAKELVLRDATTGDETVLTRIGAAVSSDPGEAE